MANVKFTNKSGKVGERYSGYDGSVNISLSVGDVANVSDEKVKQLQADFPGDFEIIKNEEAPKVTQAATANHISEAKKEHDAFLEKKGRKA